MRHAHRSFILAGVAGAFTATPVLAGDALIVAEPYVGEGWVEHGYRGLTTWRVYAVHCEEPFGYDDDLLAVYGSPDFPMTLASSDGSFHNALFFDSLLPPEDLTEFGIWENQWDTYVTISDDTTPGLYDPLTLSPGFAEITNNLSTSFTSDFIGWFRTPDDCGACPAMCSIGGGRILIAQLTVAECETVSGVVSFLTRDGVEHNSIAFAGEPPPRCSCPADLDGSGAVDVGDLLAVLAAWGPCADCPEDLDDSGTVAFGDVLVVLGSWGPCPGRPARDHSRV